jgi:predicted transposase/invertase (TIGR01784 family)
MRKRQLVSFDWALKKLLRSKANFVILEGFLSELLHEEIKIQNILESESNKNHEADKSNRVDLLVKNQQEELIIIEVQYEYEVNYLQRILYGTAKVITENIIRGDGYEQVKKVISVSIVYFDLGQGTDYIYRGTTNFIGINNHDELQLNDTQKEMYQLKEVRDIFPEYYLLKINKFDDVAKNTLDEWIYFFKNDVIKQEFTAKGLHKAASELNVMKLSLEERKEYERYSEDLMYQTDIVKSNYERGKFEGKKEGEIKGKLEVAKNLKRKGIDISTIVEVSGLSKKQIEDL